MNKRSVHIIQFKKKLMQFISNIFVRFGLIIFMVGTFLC